MRNYTYIIIGIIFLVGIGIVWHPTMLELTAMAYGYIFGWFVSLLLYKFKKDE